MSGACGFCHRSGTKRCRVEVTFRHRSRRTFSGENYGVVTGFLGPVRPAREIVWNRGDISFYGGLRRIGVQLPRQWRTRNA